MASLVFDLLAACSGRGRTPPGATPFDTVRARMDDPRDESRSGLVREAVGLLLGADGNGDVDAALPGGGVAAQWRDLEVGDGWVMYLSDPRGYIATVAESGDGAGAIRFETVVDEPDEAVRGVLEGYEGAEDGHWEGFDVTILRDLLEHYSRAR